MTSDFRRGRRGPDLGWETPRERCDEPPPQALLDGVAQFNRREFFECHETLEAAWKAERHAVRRLYQAILQVGIGFYHLERGNWDGAVKLLGSGLRYLELFRPVCQGVDVESLYREASGAHAELRRLGPERAHELDPHHVPSIKLVRGP